VQSTRSIAKNLLAWFGLHARDLPWRRTRDPYATWIAEVMLQQTQVKTVLPYWERWMKRLPDVRSLAGASETRVLKLWEGLGYYSRARNLHRAARLLVTQHRGEFPCEFDRIFALPGIGRYTAGAICSIAFNQPHPVLDGNVIRVLTRVFGVAGNPKERSTNERLWQTAGDLVTSAHAIDAETGCSHLNQSLMELGALVCLPQKPHCEKCPIRKSCAARLTDRVDELPRLPQRVRATQRRFVAFVISRRDRFLVRQRPDGAVNARLWEFPNVEVAHGETPVPAPLAAKLLDVSLASAEPLFTIRHSITRYRIFMDVFRASTKKKPTVGEWLTLAQIDNRALPSAHRKIFDQLNQ
jgi:A/G-specific adenine glycosylase